MEKLNQTKKGKTKKVGKHALNLVIYISQKNSELKLLRVV